MRLAWTLALALLAAVPAAATADPPAYAPADRVRPLQKIGGELLADGVSRSPTLRRIVQRLQRSDVIVYFELRPDMPSSMGGSLRVMAATATDRFLHVRVNRSNNRLTLIALLAHELQHALEIAETPSVRSPEALGAYYRRTGMRIAEGRFDTAAAQETGRTVRAELSRRSKPDATLARRDGPDEDGEGRSPEVRGVVW
ncbi:MAG TPA: hypothetical protein VF136_12185 [Methylomirabilota bacterium]